MKYALFSESGNGQVIKTIISGDDWRTIIDVILEICAERFEEVTDNVLDKDPEDLEDFGYDSEEEYHEDYEPYAWIDDLFTAYYDDYAEFATDASEVDMESVSHYQFSIEGIDFDVECVGESLEEFVQNFNKTKINPWILSGYSLPNNLSESSDIVRRLNNDLYKICYGSAGEDLSVFTIK